MDAASFANEYTAIRYLIEYVYIVEAFIEVPPRPPVMARSAKCRCAVSVRVATRVRAALPSPPLYAIMRDDGEDVMTTHCLPTMMSTRHAGYGQPSPARGPPPTGMPRHCPPEQWPPRHHVTAPVVGGPPTACSWCMLLRGRSGGV